MLRPILRGTLAYVGFDVLKPFLAWHVPYVSDEARQQFLVDYGQRLQHLSDDLPPVFPKLAELMTSSIGYVHLPLAISD